MRIFKLSILSICLTLSSIPASLEASATNSGKAIDVTNATVTSNQKLQKLFDDEWVARLANSPSLASSMGDSSTAARLQDVSEKAQMDWLKQTDNFLARLAKINIDELFGEETINYQIFKQQLLSRKRGLEFKSYQIPFLSDSGFHTEMAMFPSETTFKNSNDINQYLEKISQIPRFFQQNIDNMNAGLLRGFSMPQVVMQGFTDVINSHANSSVKDSVFYQPIKQLPISLPINEKNSLEEKAKLIISEKVLPAYKKLSIYFEKTYIPKTKRSLAAKDFPNGLDYYQSKIRHYTTGNLTPKQIHEIGLSEVKRIRSEMESVIKSLNFKGNFEAFLAFLRESPQFYAKTPEELIKEASYIAKKMDGQLPKFFTKLPRQPYTVEPVPSSIAPKYTTGRYVPAPLNSTRPGIYWVNTFALDKRPLYVLESLTLHEAVPGHHLQGALNKELENLPNFRRFSYISAFGEGWALYCEKLGKEAGFYQDPYSEFGRLSYEMWRAARLVIDTGIHAFGWTREQSIKLLEENSALSTHNIITEVDRYISWPGQALSYKLGELKIVELRKRAEQELGDKFDIRLFHDAILQNGSIPLDVLEKHIVEFIGLSRK